MGFWNRSWDVLTGLGGALQAPLGMVKDLATAPFTEDEYDGILGTLVGSVEDRFAQGVENLFGPDEGLGALIGGLPQGVRSQRVGGSIASGAGAGALGGAVGGPVGAGVGAIAGGIYGAVRGFEGVSDDIETIYREGIAEPLTTAMTVGSLTEAEGLGAFFSADAWKRGYRIAQERSPGQAIALAFITEDITNEAEVNRAIGTDWYRAISGTVDAVNRLIADPSVIAGRAAGSFRQAHYVRPLDSSQAVKSAAFDAKVETVLGEMDGMSAAQIRERYFRDHSHGSVVAAALADAEDVATRQQVFRSLVGDDDALSALYQQRAELAGKIDRLVGQQATANNLTRAGFELPEGMKRDLKVRTDAELEALYGTRDQLARIEAAAGTVRDLKFASWQAKPGQMLRDDLPRSTFFQESTAAAPLRLARNMGGMRPGPLVNFHDASGDITLNRLLRNADVSADVADDLRSRYVQQLDPSSRQAVFDEAVETVVEKYATRAGMSTDELERFMAESRRRRGEQYAEVSKSRSYDAKGRGVMEWLDEDGVTHRQALPIWLTQEANFGVVPNLDLLEQATSKIGRFKARHPNTDIPVQLAESFYRVWKPSVLFRVGWPIRVVGEEQLRIAAKIGAMTHASNVLRNAKEWTVEAVDHVRRGGVDLETGQSRPWSEAKERFGLGWHEVNGHKVQNAYGTPEDGVNVHKALVAQTANLQKKLYGIEDSLLKEAREQAGGWRTMQPTDPDYGKFWAHNVNKQIAQDAVGRRLLQGQGVDNVVNWLRNDPAGQAYFNRSPLYRGAASRGHTLEEVVGWQQGVIDDLTLGDSGIREKALKGNATVDDLRRAQPDEGLWQPINGGVVQEASGGSQAGKFINKQVERVYRALGGYPTTVLSRNPLFKHMYDAEVDRLTRIMGTADSTTNPRVRALAEAVVEEDPPLAINLDAIGEAQFYHGTARRLGGTDRIVADPYAGSVSGNLYGPGFYVTDDKAIALSYTKKGEKTAKAASDHAPRVYGIRWRGRGEMRMIDVEKPAPPDVRQVFAEYAAGVNRLDPADVLAELGDATGEQWYDFIKQEMRGAEFTRYDADELLVHMHDALKARGFTGLRYQGGKARGGERHEAFVVFDPSEVEITDIARPTAPAGAPPEVEAPVVPRGLTDERLRHIEQKAREYALDETRKTLFDLSEESNLAHHLRFISPFFMAQQEVLTRWVGLTAQNPAFVAKMRLVWQSPEKAGLIVDENGNTVNERGEATQPLTGEKVEAGESRYVVLPVPEWYDGPGGELLGNARFNKESLNVALQLNSGIGTGPLVQVPVNELVKDRPDLEASVKWALPYGSTQDTLGLILPATAKRMRTKADEDSDEFRNSVIRLYYDAVTDYNLGKRDTKPTFAEAQKQAKEFWSMRTVANAVLPAAPWFTSPYQLHIDAYRNAQDRYREDDTALGGQTPDEWFLDQFGEEFFALTQSISRSVDGVPPTIEGHAARKKHADLIHDLRTPSLGSLVIGEEGAGEFNRSVYEHQKLTPVRPGSDTTQREGISFEEAAAAPEVRMGWMKFSRFMDLLDAEMISAGLPNLQVKEAEGLANLKRAYIQGLAEQHPEWYREFSNPDPLAAQDRVNDLRKIASDSDLAKRHDIKGLQQYLKVRDAFTEELERRKALGGPSTLGAQGNQDLALVWETMVSKIVQENLAFGDLYHRWLSNDAPQVVAVEVAA